MLLALLLVYLDVVVGLAEGFTVQFLEIFLEFLERSLLEDGVSVEVDNGEEGLLDHLKTTLGLELLPNEQKVREIEDADEDTQKRLRARQLYNNLEVIDLILCVGLPLLQ